MRAASVLVLLISSVSADINGCAANVDPHSCHEEVALGDAMTLLQQRHMNKAEQTEENMASHEEKTLRDLPMKSEEPMTVGGCPEGQELAYGDACPVDPFGISTTPAPLCVDGKTASGKECRGEIKIKMITIPVTRPCKTASGDECAGNFKKKIRETYERKDGEWVMFKREQSQDGGKTWSPLSMSLAELATFTLSDDEAEALIPLDSCCVPATEPIIGGCEFTEWENWSACSKLCGSGTRSRSRKVLSTPAGFDGKCGCLEESEVCNVDPCGPTVGPEDETTTPSPPEPTSKVCGYVKDVSNHEKKLEGVTVTTVVGKTSTTKNDGKFCFQLPVGKVTLTAEKEGYVTEKDVVREVVEGENTIDDIEMSGPLEEDQWRIVMKWHKKPKDLDSWTLYGRGTKEDQKQFESYGAVGRWDAEKCDRNCPDKTPSGCAMSWNWKDNAPKTKQSMKCSTSGVTAFMDQDNTDITTNPYAETTTLSGVGTECKDDCNIHFCVYQYEPRPKPNEIRESGATVEVYNGVGGKAHKVDTFEIDQNHGIVKDLNDVPTQTGKSTYAAGASQWFVFSIDGKTKAVTQCKDLTSECAKMPCGAYHAR